MKLGFVPWVGFGGALAVGLFAFGGCTASITTVPCSGNNCGIGDDSGVLPDTNTPDNNTGDTVAAPTCNDCLFGQCSGQYSVCQANADCLAIYQCAIGAGANPVTCFCDPAHTNGQADYLALSSCDSQSECGTCQTTCASSNPTCPPPALGDICGTGDAGTDAADMDALMAPDTTPADCNTCLTTNCATQKAACASGSDCDKYTVCVAGCNDAMCTMNCDTMYAAGKTAAEALASCTQQSCAGPCGL